MNDRIHMMTKTAAEHLAAFIATVRDEWDAPGIVTALGNARDRGDAWQIAIGAIRAAANPTNRTPAIIALDGPHWRPAQPDDEPQPTPTPAAVEDQTCPNCGLWVPASEARQRDHRCARRAEPGARQRAFAAQANPDEETP